jgi:hypothetical protein
LLQVPTALVGSDAFQEADIVGISRSCTKWNVTVPHIRDLPRYLNQAFDVATSGRPGPVLVDLPKVRCVFPLASLPHCRLIPKKKQDAGLVREFSFPTLDLWTRIKLMGGSCDLTWLIWDLVRPPFRT